MNDFIRIYDKKETDFTKNGLAILNTARDICLRHEINGEYTLNFTMPMGEKWRHVKSENICKCAGQLFRIKNTEKGEITAYAIYLDASRKHIQYMGDCIGMKPRDIMLKLFDGTRVHIMTEDEVREKGMEWVSAPTDFFEISKITPIGAMEILKKTLNGQKENCELYIDNYNIALVKRLGKDIGEKIMLDLNAAEITPKRSTSQLVTKLYPYGKEDLHIGNVTEDGRQYVLSPNYEELGEYEGFMTFDNVESPQELLAAAQWQFNEENPERIDAPKYSIEINYVDIAKAAKNKGIHRIGLGDTVKVYDPYYRVLSQQRIKSISIYPFQPSKSKIEVGTPPSSFGSLFKQMIKSELYNKISTNEKGELKTNWLFGDINTDDNRVRDAEKVFTIDGSLLEILDPDTKLTRVELGCVERKGKKMFVFTIYGKDGQEAIYMDENGDAVFSGAVNTVKDNYVGRYLYVGQGLDDGCIYISATNDPTAASIRNTADGETIISGNKGGDIVFGDAGVCIGADLKNNVIATQGQIDKLEAEILNLKKEIAEIKK